MPPMGPAERSRLRKQKMHETGSTIVSLDYKKIEYTPEQIAYARGMVAANCKAAHGRTEIEDAKELLKALGLTPEQEGLWFEWAPGSQTSPGSGTGTSSSRVGRPPTTGSDSGSSATR